MVHRRNSQPHSFEYESHYHDQICAYGFMGFKTGCFQSTTVEEMNNKFRSFHSTKLCMTHTIRLMSSDFTIPSDTSWTKHDTRDLPPPNVLVIKITASQLPASKGASTLLVLVRRQLTAPGKSGSGADICCEEMR
jgi:hypothetical protein